MKSTAKKPIVLISCVLLFLFASGSFAYWQYNKPDQNRALLSAIFLDKQKTNSENFYEVIQHGNDAVCTFSGKSKGSDESGPGTITGRLYVSENKARLDLIVSDSSNSSVQSTYLQDGSIGYIWSAAKGVKVNLKEPNVSLFNATYVSSDIINILNQSGNFSCSRWIPDTAIFKIPDTVVFSDIANQINQVFDKMKDTQQDYCNQCAALSNESLIENCRKMRGCR